MFKAAVRSIEGLEFWPTISFTIFFIFFIGLLIYVYGFTKSHTDEMSNLPFEDNEIDVDEKNDNKNKLRT